MTAPAWTFIPDVLEEHLEELGFLWGLRMSTLRSPRDTLRDVLDLEERIHAHLQGVLAVGMRALPRVEAGLTADDPLEVFAAAFSLLHTRDTSLQSLVFEEFARTTGPRLQGLGMALSHGPLLDGRARLTVLLSADEIARAIAAASVLARRNALDPSVGQLDRFLHNEDPTIRAGGWALAAQIQPAIEARTYAAAMRDDDSAVRTAALYASAWCGERGTLAVLRSLAAHPDATNVSALELLAVIGNSDDLKTFARLSEMPELGAARFRLLGAFGHPLLVDAIITGLSDSNPAVAATAGEAFEKVTGFNVESTTLAAVSSHGPPADEFEAEFQDQVAIPDADAARVHWGAMRAQLNGVERLCRGVDMSRPIETVAFDSFDMESRWACWLRSRFHGSWNGTPMALEAFPQRP